MSYPAKPPDDNQAELMPVICWYDPNDKYPEWKVHLAKWEGGQHV